MKAKSKLRWWIAQQQMPRILREARPSALPPRTAWLRASLLTFGVVVVAIGLLVLLLGPIAWWATPAKHLSGKDKVDARNSTRQVLLTAVGGLALLTGLAFTARTFLLTRRGQFTDRYVKAIPQLASESLTERLGAIYGLEHIMFESQADHSTIVEILSTFIRENARASSSSDHELEVESESVDVKPRPRTDIQAALTVLARRPKRREFGRLDLSGTDLRGADLRWARFDAVDLRAARLDHANLSRAKLEHAFLRHARLDHARLVYTKLNWADLIDASLNSTNLGGANLSDADLRGASLSGAHLREADMRRVGLSGAVLINAHLVEVDLRQAVVDEVDFSGANLGRADLRGVDLRKCIAGSSGLTKSQLSGARTNSSTKLPEVLQKTSPSSTGSPQSEGDDPTSASPGSSSPQ
jgi:uncharacterized protein YjbI with pentapeptide repeats